MNKNQLVIMWVGIGIIVFPFVDAVMGNGSISASEFRTILATILVVGLVAGALIYTLKNKKDGNN